MFRGVAYMFILCYFTGMRKRRRSEGGNSLLYEKLKNYAASGVYPMHMPGHKRNTAFLPPGLPYSVDLTEIHGFDDLRSPDGVLRETAELAAALYSSSKAFLLVNGSTVGILSAIGAHAERGDKVLVAGNCHRSVENAVKLFGSEPVYITPEADETSGVSGSVDPAAVKAGLDENPDIKLVVITSPTYEGVISDIASISNIAHERAVPLLVDSAHGAHLGFSADFPDNATRLGADIVVMSLHKTLPALTQCSLLHVCGRFADYGKTARLLSILQTSSPSYVLMASIDYCLRLLATEKDRLFSGYYRNLECFNADISSLRKLTVLTYGPDAPHPGFFAFDPGKLVIVTKKTALSGVMLSDILRTGYDIELELARECYAVAMTSICDEPDGFTRLANALIAIDSQH